MQMENPINDNHFLDANGNPEGGQTFGNGFAIAWQRGPLGRDANRKAPNGAFVEDVIAAAKDRILWYQQDTRFKCDENDDALTYLQLTLNRLSARTARRSVAGTEGTHLGS